MTQEDQSDRYGGSLEAVILVEDHKPVAGCRLVYPMEGVGKIERVCVIREKQKDGYGRVLIAETRTRSGDIFAWRKTNMAIKNEEIFEVFSELVSINSPSL